MSVTAPILACMAGSDDREVDALIYAFIGVLIAILSLGCINFVLICITGDWRFKAAHFGWFVGYTFAVIILHFGPEVFGQTFALTMILALCVPIAVISQFVFLLRARRRFRSRGCDDF
jgi:hypothetical protein